MLDKTQLQSSGKRASRKRARREGVSFLHPVIIDFSHLDAFDSWVVYGVALRPTDQTGALPSVSRL